MRPSRQSGYTILELMVALVIGGLAITIAAALFEPIVGQSRRLAQSRRALDREVNARRWVTAAFLSLEADSLGSAPIDGQPESVAFRTRLLERSGWFETRSVQIYRDSSRVVVQQEDGARVVLWRDVSALRIEYLFAAGEPGRWGPTWTSQGIPPGAVRLLIGHRPRQGVLVTDSLVFRIKARG